MHRGGGTVSQPWAPCVWDAGIDSLPHLLEETEAQLVRAQALLPSLALSPG